MKTPVFFVIAIPNEEISDNGFDLEGEVIRRINTKKTGFNTERAAQANYLKSPQPLTSQGLIVKAAIPEEKINTKTPLISWTASKITREDTMVMFSDYTVNVDDIENISIYYGKLNPSKKTINYNPNQHAIEKSAQEMAFQTFQTYYENNPDVDPTEKIIQLVIMLGLSENDARKFIETKIKPQATANKIRLNLIKDITNQLLEKDYPIKLTEDDLSVLKLINSTLANQRLNTTEILNAVNQQATNFTKKSIFERRRALSHTVMQFLNAIKSEIQISKELYDIKDKIAVVTAATAKR